MQTQPAPARVLPRLDGIDTLRGLSILAVILLHIWLRFAIVASFRPGRSWPPMLSSLLWHNGGNGVTVFFAISGFLITLTSLRRFGTLGQVRLPVFYRIRFARIMPLLLLLLAVLSLLHLLHVESFVVNAKHFTLPRALLSALTFHLNWLEASRDAWLPASWTVLWSLSIEEAFYVFFPLVCVLLLRREISGRVSRSHGSRDRGQWGTAAWFVLALSLVAMGPFARTVWSHTDLQQENSYLAGMSDIACGCIAAWLTDRAIRQARTVSRATLLLMQLCGWLPLLVFSTWPRWHWIKPTLHFIGKSGTDDTLLAAGTSLLAASIALASRAGRPWTAPLRWFGRHSYELYLAHEFAVIAGVALFVTYAPYSAPRAVICIVVVAILAASALLGWALARFFSEPLNRKLRGAPLPTQ